MTIATLQVRPIDWLKNESDDAYRSREQITIAAGQKLVSGQVIGKISESGAYAAHNPALIDGTQTVAGILFDNVDATAGAKQGVAIVRDAMVAGDKLTYDPAADATAKALVIAELKALNGPILSRASA